jgi:hypothetical protein
MVCQSIVAFRSGQMPGMGGANALINNMHDTSINRIAGLLRRLL